MGRAAEKWCLGGGPNPASVWILIHFLDISKKKCKKPSLAEIWAPNVLAKSAEFPDHIRNFNIFEKERKSTYKWGRPPKSDFSEAAEIQPAYGF